MKPIIIKNFPLPPSVNDMLMPSRGRLIHTAESRAWKSNYMRWALFEKQDLSMYTNIIKSWESTIQVDTYFVFKKSRLISKENKMKVLDANNRVKPALDAFSYCFDIDDKEIISGLVEKVWVDDETVEQTIFVVKPKTIWGLDSLNAYLSEL